MDEDKSKIPAMVEDTTTSPCDSYIKDRLKNQIQYFDKGSNEESEMVSILKENCYSL